MRFGFKLCSEERSAEGLVQDARRAEEAGFDLVALSDHFHPWLETEGESPFAWSVLGALAGATSSITVGTAVTCPFIRLHPAIVAQAAATTASLLPGRFFLGLGTGERLNEHITGAEWPDPAERRERLGASIEVIRRLWAGEAVSYRGGIVVDRARLFSTPAEQPPIYVAASGDQSAELAGRMGDGLVSTSPNEDVVAAYRRAGGVGPVIGEVTLCWGEDEDQAMRLVRERWPIPALEGDESQELAMPEEFARATAGISDDALREKIAIGPDTDAIVGSIAKYRDAGFSEVVLHQVGDDPEAFLRLCENELLQRLREEFAESAAPSTTAG
jgi:coenzyme F420-dependent glucose-6-phosphate dehydrogenase